MYEGHALKATPSDDDYVDSKSAVDAGVMAGEFERSRQ